MFSIFVVLFNIVCHLLMSCHNLSLFIRVPCIVFYGDLLTFLKTHYYKANSMNSLNSMKELWKNSITWSCTNAENFSRRCKLYLQKGILLMDLNHLWIAFLQIYFLWRTFASITRGRAKILSDICTNLSR